MILTLVILIVTVKPDSSDSIFVLFKYCFVIIYAVAWLHLFVLSSSPFHYYWATPNSLFWWAHCSCEMLVTYMFDVYAFEISGRWSVMNSRRHCKFQHYTDCLCVCFPYICFRLFLVPVNLLRFSLAYIFPSYLLLLYLFLWE